MIEIFENQAEAIEKYKNTRRVRFDRVDRNGTHLFTDCTCNRCGGDGYIAYFGHIEQGVCFECGGSGVSTGTEIKIYTDAYGAKLKEQRAAREEAKRQKLIEESAEWNKTWLEREGFNADGVTYVVLGNTYLIKDELKAKGAKFNDMLGWHMADPQGYDVAEICVEQVTYRTYIGRFEYIMWNEGVEIVREAKDAAEKAIKAQRGEHVSEYIGNVGERRDFNCTLVGHFTFESHFSYYGEVNHIYKFEDENGDIVVWNTSSWIDDQKKNFKFKATVKEHSEYRGEKQTVVTRPKFFE